MSNNKTSKQIPSDVTKATEKDVAFSLVDMKAKPPNHSSSSYSMNKTSFSDTEAKVTKSSDRKDMEPPQGKAVPSNLTQQYDNVLDGIMERMKVSSGETSAERTLWEQKFFLLKEMYNTLKEKSEYEKKFANKKTEFESNADDKPRKDNADIEKNEYITISGENSTRKHQDIIEDKAHSTSQPKVIVEADKSLNKSEPDKNVETGPEIENRMNAIDIKEGLEISYQDSEFKQRNEFNSVIENKSSQSLSILLKGNKKIPSMQKHNEEQRISPLKEPTLYQDSENDDESGDDEDSMESKESFDGKEGNSHTSDNSAEEVSAVSSSDNESEIEIEEDDTIDMNLVKELTELGEFYENKKVEVLNKRNNKLQESKEEYHQNTYLQEKLYELFNEHKAKVFEIVEKYYSNDDQKKMSELVYNQILQLYNHYYDNYYSQKSHMMGNEDNSQEVEKFGHLMKEKHIVTRTEQVLSFAAVSKEPEGTVLKDDASDASNYISAVEDTEEISDVTHFKDNKALPGKTNLAKERTSSRSSDNKSKKRLANACLDIERSVYVAFNENQDSYYNHSPIAANLESNLQEETMFTANEDDSYGNVKGNGKVAEKGGRNQVPCRKMAVIDDNEYDDIAENENNENTMIMLSSSDSEDEDNDNSEKHQDDANDDDYNMTMNEFKEKESNMNESREKQDSITSNDAKESDNVISSTNKPAFNVETQERHSSDDREREEERYLGNFPTTCIPNEFAAVEGHFNVDTIAPKGTSERVIYSVGNLLATRNFGNMNMKMPMTAIISEFGTRYPFDFFTSIVQSAEMQALGRKNIMENGRKVSQA